MALQDYFSENRLQLNLEELEARQMLSSVIIVAAGETGMETMELAIDGQVVQTWENVGGDANNSQYNWFQYDSAQDISIDQIEIRFTNDLYEPANGIDFNLRVNEVRLDGFDYLTTAGSVYSTGTYVPGQGIVPGFHQSEYLHANGSFFFGQASPTVQFAGEEWIVERSYSPGEVEVDATGNLILRSTESPIAVSRLFTEMVPGRLATLSVTSSREIVGGTPNGGQPWATVGINFYNSQGYVIGKSNIEINSQIESGTNELQIEIPTEATSAYGWIWVDHRSTAGVDVSTIVSDFSLTAVDLTGDTTPPTASMTSFEFTENQKTEINFQIDLYDDFQLPSNPLPFGTVEVFTPNGDVLIAGARTGVAFSAEQHLIYGFNKSDGSEWSSADNGVYSVIIGNNRYSDLAGNYADAIVLGTITVNITDLPPDVSPPSISLRSPIPDVIQSTDYVSFAVTTIDDQDTNPQLQSLTLVAPDGSERPINAIAGGYDPVLNEKYEIFWVYQTPGFWGPAQNGIWTIRLDANQLTDASGNSASPKVLGQFNVNIAALA